MKQRRLAPLALTLATFLATVGILYAAPDAPEINWWTVDGGGGMSTGGAFTLKGTIGQPDAGEQLTGGSYALVGGFWSGIGVPTGGPVCLPLIVHEKSPYAPPCTPDNGYCEDYDSWQAAYGPLAFNTSYQAYPEDGTDYYYFELAATREVTVAVENYRATGDLILYKHREGDEPQTVDHWLAEHPYSSTMVLTGSLEAGKYYVRVYTVSDQTSGALYTLTLTLD